MFDNFYRLNKSEIVNLVRRYLDETLFADSPEMSGKVVVTISGSIASGFYDEFSDIDLDFYSETETSTDNFKTALSEFKKTISQKKNIPIQVHRLKNLKDIESTLKSYKSDTLLREISQSLVVFDVEDNFADIQKRYQWYPPDIAKEKLDWLFAQLIFEYEEHFKIAVQRTDDYYLQLTKLQILRLVGNIELLVHKRWPSYDKHLLSSMKAGGCTPNTLELFDATLKASNNTLPGSVNKLIQTTEANLVASDLIPKEPAQYWVDLRPAYSVEISQ